MRSRNCGAPGLSELRMGITISDIKRAVSSNGDVSAYARFWHQALGNPSVPSLSSLEGLADLPDAVEWLQSVDESLALLVADWAEQRDNRPLPSANVELTLVGLAPYGRNVGPYLEHIIDEVRPDIIALDISPLDLSAHLLYAFSLPCAIGLPASAISYPGKAESSIPVRTFIRATHSRPPSSKAGWVKSRY